MKMHLKNKGIHPIIFIVIGNIILFISTSFLNLPKSRQWADDLLDESTFKNPDKGYYPETWFHFIGGNISKEGITVVSWTVWGCLAGGFSSNKMFERIMGGTYPLDGKRMQAIELEFHHAELPRLVIRRRPMD